MEAGYTGPAKVSAERTDSRLTRWDASPNTYKQSSLLVFSRHIAAPPVAASLRGWAEKKA